MQVSSLLIPEGRYSEGSAQDQKTESQIRKMHHAKVSPDTEVLEFIAVVVLILQPPTA